MTYNVFGGTLNPTTTTNYPRRSKVLMTRRYTNLRLPLPSIVVLILYTAWENI